MKKHMILAATVLVVLMAGEALAAGIGIAPTNVALKLATGESGSTTVIGNVSNPPQMPYSIALQLRPVAGSLPGSWLVTQPAMLTNRSSSALLTLMVKVPATAAPGTYMALVQPMVLATTIPLTPVTSPLQLAVNVTSKCAAPPTVAVASAKPAELSPPNGRLEEVGIAGSIVLPVGCSLGRAWYTLSDEYGVLAETKDIAVGGDGSFGFSAPLQVSRRGDDKDGRLYQFTVYAADDVGTGASAPVAVVVRHDQRGDK